MNRRSQAYPCSATKHTAHESRTIQHKPKKKRRSRPSKTPQPWKEKLLMNPFWTTAATSAISTEASNDHSSLQPWHRKHTQMDMSVTVNPGQNYLWSMTPDCSVFPRFQVSPKHKETLHTSNPRPSARTQVNPSVFSLIKNGCGRLTVSSTVSRRREQSTQGKTKVSTVQTSPFPQWMLIQIPRNVHNTNFAKLKTLHHRTEGS